MNLDREMKGEQSKLGKKGSTLLDCRRLNAVSGRKRRGTRKSFKTKQLNRQE
jgi:hypothetical protein